MQEGARRKSKRIIPDFPRLCAFPEEGLRRRIQCREKPPRCPGAVAASPMPELLHPIPPGPGFWAKVARRLMAGARQTTDLSERLVLVPTYAHIVQLRDALSAELGGSFLPPQIRTLDSWLEQQPPDVQAEPPSTATERLMTLYASLRDIGWLKKLFAARRNTDLMPLAQTLIALGDELSAALLPAALAQPAQVADRWRAALEQLSPRAAALLSDEAQLVWQLWQVERDERDPGLARHRALQRAAEAAPCPLAWCSPWEPDALERAFLERWSQRQPVERIAIDWSAAVLPGLMVAAWPEMTDDGGAAGQVLQPTQPLDGLLLLEATGMENEAQAAAQTIVDWIGQGLQRIALVPQDRVVARRLRALLERAGVVVADETGWKLSTTRAATALHAWIELVASRGDPERLLDFLKSPFILHPALADPAQRNGLESALVGAGVAAGWDALVHALDAQPQAKSLVEAIAREGQRYAARKPVSGWVDATLSAFDALGSAEAIARDKAGAQVLEMLAKLARDCERLEHPFSLNEWRVLLDMQMEQTVFVAPRDDRRVIMVPLNGSMLRDFDAAIVVGADAEHLPSRPSEVLFFANAVRRELGLDTRESRQRQQLREFASLLLGCPRVVLSWQARRDGESVAPSPWLQRLELALEAAGLPRLPRHVPSLAQAALEPVPAAMPAPAAPALLPSSLSASGYNSLVACPYQFFASRMLGLRAPDELSELPEKRDYGDWLHQILRLYHETLAKAPLPRAERGVLMARLTDEVFGPALARNPAALGFLSRWTANRDAYIAWANDLEDQGWSFAFGEERITRALDWGGGSLRLVGKLDRVDRHADGGTMVLDYKTSKRAALKGRLKEREDHQLPFYALLLEPAPVRAAYVAIDEDTPAAVEAEQLDRWREALHGQLGANMAAISAGTVLPASGSAGSCAWCEVRGLCRKGAW